MKTFQFGTEVFDFLAAHTRNPAAITADELDAIRAAAFAWSRNAKDADPLVPEARNLAAAVLVWAGDPTPVRYAEIRRASRGYEEARIR